LVSLPKTLDDTYDRILCGIPEEYSEYAFKILQWLTYSARPLKLEELAEVIAVNTEGPPWFDEEALFPEPKDLIAICSSLVVAKPLLANRASNSLDVSLAHFSVKEYLVSERIQHQKAAKYSISEIRSNESIAATCLAYLLQFDQESHLYLPDHEARNMHPLLSYAVVHWTRHAKNLSPHRGPLGRLCLELFRPDRTTYTFWLRQHILPLGADRAEDPSPLLMMAMNGVVGMVEMLLDSDAPINENGDHGSALGQATTYGHEEVVKLLLAHGAEVNTEYGRLGSPMQEASRLGYVDIVKALIDAGADVNRGNRHQASALQAAAREGHLNVVQLLTSAKAQVNQESGAYTTALIAACLDKTTSPHTYAVAQHLLSKGTDITTTNGAVGSALHAACTKRRADVELARLLVSEGAEIDAFGGKYGTALQAACAHHGNDEIIRFLISEGADPHTFVPGSKYGTALQAVCAENHDNDAIADFLLDNGAPRNIRGGKYGTALQAACAQNNLEVVKLLLRKDGPVEGVISQEETSICAYGGEYGSALNAACYRNRKEIASFLLDSGAEINANVGTGKYGTPLLCACIQHNVGIVKLLLDRGADITVQAEAGARGPGNVLRAIVNRKFLEKAEQILHMLYAHGAVRIESWLEPPERIRIAKLKEKLGILV